MLDNVHTSIEALPLLLCEEATGLPLQLQALTAGCAVNQQCEPPATSLQRSGHSS